MKDQIIIIPNSYGFKDYGIFNFDKALKIFDWNLENCTVTIDASECDVANYQAKALIPLYLWHLRYVEKNGSTRLA